MTTLLKLFRTTTFRLVLMYAVLFACAALLAIAYISWTSSRLLEERIKETVLAETLGLAEQYRSGGINRLADVINKRVRNPSNSIYLVTDDKGGWIAGNVKSLTRDLWNTQGRVEFVYQRRGPEGKETRHAMARIYRLARDYRLMVGRDVEDQRQFAKLIRNAVLSGLVFMMLVGLGGGWLVSQHLLRRIDAVTNTSRVIMAGDMTRRVPIDGTGDELDRLAINLNAMLDRIEQLMTGLREVSDNIAHDLKTPLTRMRNRVEAVLREEVDGEYKDVLEKTIEESDELIRTFNSLLSIAKLEAGGGSASFDTHDLSEILSDVVELYEPLAEERGLQLELRNVHSLSVEVDRQLVGQAIANLIDNAIKYGMPDSYDRQPKIILEGGRYMNSSQRAENDCRFYIAVSDNGRGIPEHEYDHAVKRFGRLEESRSKPGTGLGLSLVVAVAKLHKGDFRLEDNKPGLVGRIIIPCKSTYVELKDDIAS